MAQNSKIVENYIFPHCLRYPILFQVICNRNQLYSFKIGASQAKPKYTKDFPENTKENSKSQYFENFYDLIIQKFIEQHPAAILRSWRFFWYPYWHIHEWNKSKFIHVKYVKNVIFDIYDKFYIHGIGHICQWWICQYGCQLKRKDLRIAAKYNLLNFWMTIKKNFQNTDFQNFPLYFQGNPLYN